MIPEAERSQIDFMAAGKWEELRAALRHSCASVGSGIRLQVLEDSAEEFIVERIEGDWIPKRLRLEFVSRAPMITWSCCDPNENRGEIHFRVFNDSVFYVVNNRNRPLSEIVMVLTSCVAGKA
jgi:hypothetical protein